MPPVASRTPGAVSGLPPCEALSVSPGGREPASTQEPRLIVSETVNAIGGMAVPCVADAGLEGDAMSAVAPARVCTAPRLAALARMAFNTTPTGDAAKISAAA